MGEITEVGYTFVTIRSPKFQKKNFSRKILFLAELFFGRKNKHQIERCNKIPLDLRVQIWSVGYFLSDNPFPAILFRQYILLFLTCEPFPITRCPMSF
jgi:hypothetical protein